MEINYKTNNAILALLLEQQEIEKVKQEVGLVSNGDKYETHAGKFFTSENLITLRDKQTLGLGSGNYAGLLAAEYDGAKDGLLAIGADGNAWVGDIDALNLIAAFSNEVGAINDQEIAYYDNTKKKLKTKAESSLSVAFASNADKLYGYQASDFPRKDENATIKGQWSVDNILSISNKLVVPEITHQTEGNELMVRTRLMVEPTDPEAYTHLGVYRTVTDTKHFGGFFFNSSGDFYLENWNQDAGTAFSAIRLTKTGIPQFSTDNFTTSYTMWHSGNDGSGSGLDADKVDGLHASQFLRSDADDYKYGRTWFNGPVDSQGGSGAIAQFNGFIRTGSIYLHSGGNTPNNTRNSDALSNSDTGNLLWRGNTVWTALNDGSGSGLDADKVDGLQASQFLRSDVNDTINGELTTNTKYAITFGADDWLCGINSSGSRIRIFGVGADDHIYLGGIDLTQLGDTKIRRKGIDKLIIGNSLTTSSNILQVPEIRLNDSNLRLLDGGSSLQVSTQSGYLKIGPENTTWCHFRTDRPEFWLEKRINIQGGGVSSYNSDLLLQYQKSTKLKLGSSITTHYNILQDSNFTASGFVNNGWRLHNNIGGESHLEVDNLTVRNQFNVYELVTNRIRANNGIHWFTDSIKCTSWNKGSYYDIHFDNDGGNIPKPFVAGDYIQFQTFDGRSVRSGKYKVSTYNEADSNTVYCTKVSGDDPSAGDVFVRYDSSVSDRRGSIFVDTVSSGAPFLDVTKGNGSGTLSTHLRLGKLTGVGSNTGYGIWGSSDGTSEAFVISSDGYAKIAGWNIKSNMIEKTTASGQVALLATNNRNTIICSKGNVFGYFGETWNYDTNKTSGHMGISFGDETGGNVKEYFRLDSAVRRIAGWSFDNSRIYSSGSNIQIKSTSKQISILDNSGDFHVALGQTADENGDGTGCYGISAFNMASGDEYFRLDNGVQRIAGWNFTNKYLRKGTGSSNDDIGLLINSENSGSGSFYNHSQKLKGYSLTWYKSNNAGHIVMGQVASNGSTIKTGYHGIQMMNWLGHEYFCLSAKTNQVGSYPVYNRIAGWEFNTKYLYKNSVYLGSNDLRSVNAANRLLIGNYDTSNPHVKVLGNSTSDYTQMYWNGTSDWGIKGTTAANGEVFRLGSSNHIAGWNFTNGELFNTLDSRHLGLSNITTGTNNDSRGRRGFWIYNDDSTLQSSASSVKVIRVGSLSDRGSLTNYTDSNNYGIQIWQGTSSGGRDIFRADKDGATIAGWNFDHTALWTGSKQSSNAFTTSGLTIHKDGAIRAKNFRIDTDGSAYFKGEVDAETGNIAGFSFDDTQMWYGSFPRSIGVTIGSESDGGYIDIRGNDENTNLLYMQNGRIQHQLGEFLAADVWVRGDLKLRLNKPTSPYYSDNIVKMGTFTSTTDGNQTVTVPGLSRILYVFSQIMGSNKNGAITPSTTTNTFTFNRDDAVGGSPTVIYMAIGY